MVFGVQWKINGVDLIKEALFNERWADNSYNSLQIFTTVYLINNLCVSKSNGLIKI